MENIEIKKLAKVDPIHLGLYVCAKLGSMSHLKMQKMLYYIQALHLAYFEEELFGEDFQAWLHGPVLKSVFIHFKHHENFSMHDEFKIKKDHIKQAIDLIEKKVTVEQLELIQEVIEDYGVMSGVQLERLTHSEPPWTNARKGVPIGDPSTNLIRKSEMQTYYKKQLYGQGEEE